jgi:hypothetical protein
MVTKHTLLHARKLQMLKYKSEHDAKQHHFQEIDRSIKEQYNFRPSVFIYQAYHVNV